MMANTIIALETSVATQDVNLAGVTVDGAIVLATALLAAGNPLDRTKVIEVQLEYEADEPQALAIDHSTDGGLNWDPYSSITVDVTEGPTILSIRKTLVGHNLQLRLSSETLGSLRVLAFVPRVVQEAKVKP